MKLYLIRHAQTEGNLHPEAYPWNNDCPITEEGRRQANALAEFLITSDVTPTRIIVSPLLRTRQTADILARKLGQTFHIDERLREGDIGDWNDWDDATAYAAFQQIPVEERFTFVPPHGESWQHAGQRVASVVQEYQSVGTLVLISHYEPLQAVTGTLLGSGFADWAAYDYPNASLTLLESMNGQAWHADYVGRTIPPDVA